MCIIILQIQLLPAQEEAVLRCAIGANVTKIFSVPEEKRRIMEYKFLVLDIDGTVTNSQKEITPKTREAIIRLQEKGVPVAIASGRPPKGVYKVADCLCFQEFGSYILPFNGARILNYKTKECVFEKTLPLSLPARLWRDAVENRLGIITYRDEVIYSGTEPDEYMAIESRINDMPIEYREDFGSFINYPVNKCLMTGRGEDLEALEPMLAQKYIHEAQVFRSEPYFLEITPKNVDKAYSLKHLLPILGIRREELVCCGDGFNDVSMIQFAGLGVAMANAQEKVKERADYITERNNDQDGIAEVIEKFFGVSV